MCLMMLSCSQANIKTSLDKREITYDNIAVSMPTIVKIA
jgi:hypothetical protein